MEINELRDEQRIVAESGSRPSTQSSSAHPRMRMVRWVAGGAAASLFFVVAAFGTVQESPLPMTTLQVEQQLSPQIEVLGNQSASGFVQEDRFQRGDTFAALLDRLGVDDTEAQRMLSDRMAVTALKALRPGMSIQAKTNEDGNLMSLWFLSAKDRLISIDAAQDGFRTNEQQANLTRSVAMKSGQIRSSLFAATDDAGVPDSVASQLADIFGGDVDFHRDLRRGDHFTVVYETLILDGRQVRSGRVLAAEFVNQNRAFRAVWFDGGDGKGGYFTPSGRNLRKAFLRSPLEFSRITSGFAMRFHPILKQWRAHQGVDYGAPTGTRVKATGDGVVEFVGREGGYGNMIIIRHNGTYSTRYGHLSGFAQGISRGARVAQGDVIGYVGQTGMATGPHLHYEFRINNEYRNPLTLAFPAAEPVATERMAAFRAATSPLAARLDLLRETNLALLE
jgi:murein DD-endopeptidase MepM/ murein hydrolase activator NlpD